MTLPTVSLPTVSLRLQRLLGGSVAALLTANAFAVAHLGNDESASDRLRRPAATGDAIVPTSETPPSVALITTGDGRTFMADPDTAEGRRAIAQARSEGGTVRNVAVPPRTTSAEPGGSLPRSVDLPGLFSSLLPKGTPVPKAGDDDGLLEIVDPGLVQGLLQDPVGTATSIVQSTPSTVASVVGTATSTVSSIVQSTPSTVASVVGTATSTVSSILAPTPTPTSAPPLSQVVTTVVRLVESVTPTTAPPAPTTPTTTSICTLLVHC